MNSDTSYRPGFTYIILDFFGVFMFLSSVVCCKKCHGEVTFATSSRQGLGFKLILKCKNCEPASVDSSPLTKDGRYDVNFKILLALRLLGVDQLRLVGDFCRSMDLSLWGRINDLFDLSNSINIAVETVAKESMKKALQLEKEESTKQKEKGVSVSSEITWQQQEAPIIDIDTHVPIYQFGFVTLIGWHTGKIVDVAMVHNALNNEVSAAIKMLSRSEDENGLQYDRCLIEICSNHFEDIEKLKPYKSLTLQKFVPTEAQRERSGIWNKILWKIASRNANQYLPSVLTAGNIAVCIFNDFPERGGESIRKIMKLLGIIVGKNCNNYCSNKDFSRN